MDFKFTDEQQLLVEGLRELLAEETPESYMQEVDAKGEYPYKLLQVLVDNGYTTLGLPEEYGGTPASILTQALVLEEIGRAGGQFYSFLHGITLNDVFLFGNEKQKKIAMELAVSGKPPFAIGISEPQAGSDDNAIATTATRRNGKVYINGQKTFISLAGHTPYILCFTKDPNVEDDKKAVSMWMFPMDLPGIKVEQIHKIGLKACPTYNVYFDEVEIEEDDLVGVEGNGFMQLMKNLEIERILIAAGSLGAAEAAFEDAAKYANQRVQFKKTIGSFQLIQNKITEMATDIENMRFQVYKAANDLDEGKSGQISSAMCKYFCAQACGRVVDSAMQIMGGIGYTSEHRVSRLWRDARVERIAGGTEEVMVHILGRALLKKYK